MNLFEYPAKTVIKKTLLSNREFIPATTYPSFVINGFGCLNDVENTSFTIPIPSLK
jgi:hypothetical protein